MSVPVPMWQCSVVCYFQCLYQCGSALLCDTLSACTSMAIICFVIVSKPIPKWQCFVVWSCQCLYQCGSAILCDTVSASSNVAVLCCVILWVPVKYSLSDTVCSCTNVTVYVLIYQRSLWRKNNFPPSKKSISFPILTSLFRRASLHFNAFCVSEFDSTVSDSQC